jgi:adenylate cyclase
MGDESMAKKSLKRKLAAILSADVEGYSRLMSNDEANTIHTLTAYKEAMTSQIEQNRGRVVDAPGDNLLAEFASVVDAVQCAFEIQQHLSKRNKELPEERKMFFRIGVNLGDIIEEKDRIYGDGVNIAARLEGICNGGGVCISGTAFEHVENKLDLEFEDLGEHEVKNIKKPVRVYRIQLRTKPKEKINVPHQKPSIAVLPFTNFSNDPDQDYLADGTSENIITALSKVPDLLVVARNSTFTYKGKAVKVQQVGRELAVKYVLEGSIQSSGNRVRIHVQLIDATVGHHIWAERYDRILEDIFDLQDEITIKIVTALQVKLTADEQARFRINSTNNLEAWGNLIEAVKYLHRATAEDIAKARELCEQALQKDPNYIAAINALTWTYLRDARFGLGKLRERALNKAIELNQRAFKLDNTEPSSYAAKSQISLLKKRFDDALRFGEKSILLGPNYADLHAFYAQVKFSVGMWEDCIALTKKAMRLNPFYPPYYLYFLGVSYARVGKIDEAIANLKDCIAREPDSWLGYVGLAILYVKIDMVKKARDLIDKVHQLNIGFSLEYLKQIAIYKDSAILQDAVDALHKAGLK